MKKWHQSDLTAARPVMPAPCLSILEFQDNSGESHDFDILKTPERLVFGGYCNAGFLESGYIERQEGESLEDTLSELLRDLEAYYNGGPGAAVRIVCNGRM